MPIFISAPRTVSIGERTTISSSIRLPDGEFEMFFRGPAGVLAAHTADAFVAAMLTTAMQRGEALIVDGTVSGALLENLRSIQEIFCCWRPSFSMVEVRAAVAAPVSDGRPPSGAAAFFSGGVDSFHTVTRHREEISALVLVHGFDMPLEQVALRARVSESLGRSAHRLGLPFVEVETNSRELTDRYVSWLHEQFGPALCSVGALLSRVASRVLIPSSSTYDYLEPFASHPILDHLWSTDRVRMIHDGAAFNRARKVAELADHAVAMDSLRVCWRNPDGAYNCGRCEKCLRTIANLLACGALSRCATFDAADRAGLRTLSIDGPISLHFVEENVRALRVSGADPEAASWLEASVARFRREQLYGSLRAQPLAEWTQLGAMITRTAGRKLLRLVRASPVR